MKRILATVFSTAWRILLAAVICAAMIVVVFALPEVADYQNTPLKVCLLFIPAALVVALGPLFLFRK